jgi:predicted nuclease of restriction endonuclease-like RecB superfamily
MLPANLLRAKVKNRGKNIEPLFCKHAGDTNRPDDDEIRLAAKLIDEFNESWKNNERNGLLSERINLLEEQYGDFKLVRALYTLLQRRCVFGPNKKTFSETDCTTTRKNVINGLGSRKVPGLAGRLIDPFYIRRQLFEESSKRGFALTDLERAEIIDLVALRTGTSADTIADNMWSDLEDNMVIDDFFSLSPRELIGWYNLSLVQTMLFNCTHLEFFVSGGSNWKRVLRDLKRLGLMYHLEQRQTTSQVTHYENKRMQRNENPKPQGKEEPKIVCTVSGPLSIFKLTDRYGTSIAKLIPSIICAGNWFIKASVVRRNIISGKKIYEFELSHDKSPLLLCEPFRNHSKVTESNERFGNSNIDNTSSTIYDSKVEENFAKRFIQSGTGWSLIREPDPIVLSDGKALIPDFMFEKYGKKMYFEIVGFWTKEYIERKLEKIRDLSSTQASNKLDFLVAVNSDYYAAASNSDGSGQRMGVFKLSNFIEKNHLITYKDDNIPLKPILDYLKNIERVLEREIATRRSGELIEEIEKINQRIHRENTLVSIGDIAKKYGMPVEAVLRIINSRFRIGATTTEDKDEKANFTVVGRFLVSQVMASKLSSILEAKRITNFHEATLVFTEHGIPDECHTDLISKLGFEIVWEGIDYNAAKIEKINSQVQR